MDIGVVVILDNSWSGMQDSNSSFNRLFTRNDPRSVRGKRDGIEEEAGDDDAGKFPSGLFPIKISRR